MRKLLALTAVGMGILAAPAYASVSPTTCTGPEWNGLDSGMPERLEGFDAKGAHSAIVVSWFNPTIELPPNPGEHGDTLSSVTVGTRIPGGTLTKQTISSPALGFEVTEIRGLPPGSYTVLGMARYEYGPFRDWINGGFDTGACYTSTAAVWGVPVS